MTSPDYADFINRKTHMGGNYGFAPTFIPDAAFDFQRHLIEWAVNKGRAALFADCGLGKSLMQLSYAENVIRHTNKPVLLLTPLSVGIQMVEEASKFGVFAARSTTGKHDGKPKVVITNYEKLHMFDPNDFAGDIIRLHEANGWKYIARHCVFKEPLGVRLRTMAKGLAHKTIVDDSSLCDVASADYLLLFRRDGENQVPVAHPTGLHSYAGSRQMPHELLTFKGHTGKQTENRFSHWIWRQYASAFWDDVRIERVLPYKECKDPDDEKHVHPLQLDVIERVVVLRSNPGEVVLTPFLGVGSEAYGAIINGRRAIGIELKEAYYKQAVLNCTAAAQGIAREEMPLFGAAMGQDES